MGAYKDKNIGIQDLDYLIESIQTAKSGRGRKDHGKGFDNKQVVWMIIAWTKICIRTEISGDTGWYTWLSKRDPSNLTGTQKRSDVLVLALEQYQRALENDGDTTSYYHRAADAMMNFVWDYRQHIVDDVDKDTDFVNSIRPLMSMGVEQFMEKLPVFPGGMN